MSESTHRTTRAVEELKAVSARLTILHDHLEGQRWMRMGRNGYVLSVVAPIFLSLWFLASLFRMDVAGMQKMG
ncbi:MAG: CorA family divalent cation transporter [Rhodovulum sp.]